MKISKTILSLTGVFLSLIIHAQQSYSKEFSFSSDNDLFISYVNDKYYSSGLFLEYRYIDKKSSLKEKRIHQWSLNQEIYTPFKSIITAREDHDRPFAGYLYVTYSVLNASEKSSKESSFQIGVVGPMALGKEFQVWIHNVYGFPEPIGWKYQIENILAVQYEREVIKKTGKKNSSFIDFFYSYGYSVGTVKTNARFSLQGRIGTTKLSNFQNSLAFRTNLNYKESRNIESFFHWKINSRFVIYDATMQGSLFNNNSPITFTPNRMQFSAELGYLFTVQSWNFGYRAVLNSNERSGLTRNNGHFFGGIFVSKLFH